MNQTVERNLDISSTQLGSRSAQQPVELHVQHRGLETGIPLVFLNSLGTDLRMWNQQVEALSPHHRIVQLDTRGHGQSPVTQGPYTLDLLCADVIHTLDRLGIAQANFCGISMGGMMAMNLAIQYPHRVNKVVAANTAALIGQPTAWKERAALVRAEGMAPVVAGAAGRWFTTAFAASQPDWVNALLGQLAATSPEGYAACCEALAQADLRNLVSRIKAEVCVIAGELDPVTTVKDGHFLTQEIPHSHLELLPASHLSNVECAAHFSEVLLEFFKRSQ